MDDGRGELADALASLETARRRLVSLVDGSDIAIFTLARDGTCVDVNAVAARMFRTPREALLGAGFGRLALRGRPAIGDVATRVRIAGEPITLRAVMTRGDGVEIEVAGKAIPIGGGDHGSYVLLDDVTASVSHERKTAAQASRVRALYLISAAVGTPHAMQIESALRLVLDALGLEHGYVGAVDGDELVVEHTVGDGTAGPGDRLPLARTFASEALALGDVVAVEDITARPQPRPDMLRFPGFRAFIAAPLTIDGRTYGAIGSSSRLAIPFDSYDRDFVRLVAVLVSSAIERRDQRRALDRLAYVDALTGLANRARFLEMLDAEISRAERHDARFAIHAIDLDGFKSINDRSGHRVGDLALEETGRRLQDAVRRYETPARVGGDEFMVLQSDLSSPGDAQSLARRILDVIDRPYEIGGTSYRVSASVGIACFPDHGREASTLLQRADVALYAAKAAGKGRFVVVETEA